MTRHLQKIIIFITLAALLQKAHTASVFGFLDDNSELVKMLKNLLVSGPQLDAIKEVVSDEKKQVLGETQDLGNIKENLSIESKELNTADILRQVHADFKEEQNKEFEELKALEEKLNQASREEQNNAKMLGNEKLDLDMKQAVKETPIANNQGAQIIAKSEQFDNLQQQQPQQLNAEQIIKENDSITQEQKQILVAQTKDSPVETFIQEQQKQENMNENQNEDLEKLRISAAAAKDQLTQNEKQEIKEGIDYTDLSKEDIQQKSVKGPQAAEQKFAENIKRDPNILPVQETIP